MSSSENELVTKSVTSRNSSFNKETKYQDKQLKINAL